MEVHGNMFLSISMIACPLRYTRMVTYCPKFLNTVVGPVLMWIIQYHVLDKKSETQDTRRMCQSTGAFPSLAALAMSPPLFSASCFSKT